MFGKKTRTNAIVAIFMFNVIILGFLVVYFGEGITSKQQVLPTHVTVPTNAVAVDSPPENALEVVEDEVATNVPEEVAIAATDTPLAIPTATPLVIDEDISSIPQDIPTLVPSVPQTISVSPPQVVKNQIVIHFSPSASNAEREAYIQQIGGTARQSLDALNTVVVTVPDTVVSQPLPPSSFVIQSEPDYYVSALMDISVPTNDPYYNQQWALPVIGASDAWLELSADAPQVTVAVIDSGICADHPDLLGRILPGYDFVEDDFTPQDELGHGCSVTGIIAANIDNGVGIAGVAPNAKVMPLRVLDASGIGTYSDVAAAIVYAADNGATIINLSLGGANTSTTLQNAIDYAIAQDVLVIAAAGNTGGSILYPAAYDPVIAVASVDSDLQISSFSSRGPEIDLFAPGRDILTTANGSSYTTTSGTSFSAPHVAGVAALETALGNTLTINGGIVSVNGLFIQQPTPVPTELPPDGVASQSKVSHDLAALLTQYQAFQAQAQGANTPFAATNIFMPLRNERVVIHATASADPYLLLADLQALGLQKGAVAGYLVSGQLPINSISSLPTLDSLQFVNPAYSITRDGLVTSQGDQAMQADIARATYGVDGSGIRIGIISNSFDCEGTAPNTGDLPSDIIILQDAPCSNASPGVTSGIGAGDDEGRGIGEVIYDVAPGASLSFRATNGLADFAQGIKDLCGISGASITSSETTSLASGYANVIIDDILYLDEPMFQDGIVDQAISACDVAYFTSAGNDAEQSYEDEYRNSEVEGEAVTLAGPGIRHDFDPGVGVDDLQSVTIPVGVAIQIVLQWDEPFYSVSGAPGSASDLAIYLYNSSGTLVAPLPSQGADYYPDYPNIGNDPFEYLYYFNDGSYGESFQLAIQLNEGPAPTRIKYVYFNSLMTVDEYATNSSTLYGHVNAEDAEAVGAAFYGYTPVFGTNPPLLEDFSSPGGTPILFDAAGTRLASPIIRQKPEIVAPDGGNTTFFGDDIAYDTDTYPNFFGTSASAPHAAAVAALMLEYNSSLTPAEVYAYMESTAIDMGTVGFDYASGYGLIDASAILAALPILVNNDPVAENDATSTDEDTPVDITVLSNDSDIDGDILTVSDISVQASDGAAVVNPDNSITYTPNADFYGDDSFVYTLSDGNGGSDTATVDVTVAPINDAPELAAIGDQSLDEGDTLVLNLSASDIDSLTLSFSINPEAPAFVSLFDNGDDTATLTIAPTISDVGTYEATITVSDGDLSDSETISISVGEVNQPPIADDQNVSTDEDVALDITLTGSDPDSDVLIFAVLSTPTNGELSGTFPNLTYTPDADFNGDDSFTFEACDPEPLCDTGTISITVDPVNDAPDTENDIYEVSNDEKLIVAAPGILSNDMDIEGDALSATMVDAPTNGNVILYADGSFTYTPYLDFVGSDTFTYVAFDGVVESNITTVTINVLDANVAPVAVGEEYVVNTNGLLTVPAPGVLVKDTDADDDSLLPILVTDVSNGQLKLRPDGSLQYAPDIGFTGVDSFTYRVSDGGLESNVVTVIINVISAIYTPENINLLLNPNFDNGFKDWELIGAQIWSMRNAVTIYRAQRHATAIIYQSVEADILAGSPIEAHVDLSNHSSETRLVELRITSLSTYDSLSCNVLVPPNTPAQTLTMTGLTGTDYSGVLFEVVAYAPDEVFVTMDNTGLYWRPDEAYTTTECSGF